jgi:uncharacterized protein YndB with AHSA1/START domain
MEKLKELKIKRLFNVPVQFVWKAWSDPEIMKQWWGPRDFTAPVMKIDFKVGGKSLSSMRGPDGKEFWSTGVYSEIVPMKRIVSTDSFSDEKGNVIPASNYGLSGDFPRELKITVNFEDKGTKTKMILTHYGFPNKKELESAEQGWSQSFDKLEHILEKINNPVLV